MNRQWKLLTAALAIFSTLLLFSLALAGESANYRSYPQVLDNSGGRSTSSGYQARASIGQPVVGPSESDAGTFYAGYLYGAYALPAPTTNKRIAISRLESIRHLLSDPDKMKADDAIRELKQSLDDRFWLGAWRLCQSKRSKPHIDGYIPDDPPARGEMILGGPKDDWVYIGEKRFGDFAMKMEKSAAKKVKEILLTKKLSSEVVAQLLATAGNIMTADSTLAQVKIVEAELSGGDPAELQKAREDMAKAEREKRRPHPEYGEVVDFYNMAWHHAVRAEEEGGGSGNLQVASIQDSKPVFALGKPYPNPSRSGSIVRFGIAEQCDVSLRIYDVTGRLIRTLVDAEKLPGYYMCDWDSRDDSGKDVASGTYVFRLIAGSFTSARVLVVVR